jgi:hypothetical protein
MPIFNSFFVLSSPTFLFLPFCFLSFSNTLLSFYHLLILCLSLFFSFSVFFFCITFVHLFSLRYL